MDNLPYTIYVLYLRFSPRHNWMCEGTTLNNKERHASLVDFLRKDCNYNKSWNDKYPNHQIGEMIITTDLSQSVYPSMDMLDNQLPSNKNIHII